MSGVELDDDEDQSKVFNLLLKEIKRKTYLELYYIQTEPIINIQAIQYSIHCRSLWIYIILVMIESWRQVYSKLHRLGPDCELLITTCVLNPNPYNPLKMEEMVNLSSW